MGYPVRLRLKGDAVKKTFGLMCLLMVGNDLWGMGRWVSLCGAKGFEGQPWLHVNCRCYDERCERMWKALLDNHEMGAIVAFVLVHGAGTCDDRRRPSGQPVKK